MAYHAYPAQMDRDRGAIINLWRESLSNERIASVIDRRLEWFYEHNPAGPAHTWLVARQETEEVVGCASMYPRTLWVEGRTVTAGVLCDFAVAKGHRVLGPAITLQRAMAKASLEAGFELLYGYPNDKAIPIFKRIGYTMVGDTTMWVKPLRAAYKLREYVSRPVAWAVGLFADQLLTANDLRLLLVRPGGVRDQVRDQPNEHFDALWQRGKRCQPIAGERTAAYLAWRYQRHATERCRFFCLFDRAGRLEGYVAYRVADDKVFVLDAFWDGGTNLLEVLLVRFAMRMRAAGYVSLCIIYAGDDALLRSLERLTFVRREGTRKLICYVDKQQPAELREAVGDLQRWSMFDGELDI